MSTAAETIRQTALPDRRNGLVAKPESRLPLSFSRRIPEIDGYRGIAVAMGLFSHFVRGAILTHPPALLGYLNASTRLFWSTLDLFFLLSGFLIGGHLLDARDSRNYFKTYYIRRASRILPVYFLFLGLVALAYHFVYRPIGAPLDWAFAAKLPWYAYLSFAQNLWMAKWNTVGPPVLAITWSLAVEEQFYLTLPFLIKFVRRSTLPYVFAAGIVLAPIVRLYIVHRFPTHLWATYVLLPCRMDALFLGALCAYFLRMPEGWNWVITRRGTLWTMFFVLLAGMPALNNTGVPLTLLYITVGYGWMCAFYATVLILALTDSQSLFSRVMRRRWLTTLGAIAYGVFLFHFGIYSLFVWLFTGHGWLLASWKDLGVTLLSVAFTIGFCKLLWQYFEKPIIRWSHSWQY